MRPNLKESCDCSALPTLWETEAHCQNNWIMWVAAFEFTLRFLRFEMIGRQGLKLDTG